MPPAQDETPAGTTASRSRLRRAARTLVKVGGILLAISLVLALVGGLTTRNLLTHLQSSSAELLDGSATVELTAGDVRSLYVTGGLVAPGELVPTPVDQITCTVQGPRAEVPVTHLKDEDQKIGIDTALARFQVVGSFQAVDNGPHEITCDGLGVVVAPQVGPADALLRLGSLGLGSLGVFAGATLLLIGGILRLLVRRGQGEPEDEDEDDDTDLPPEQGAEEWWEEEAATRPARPDSAGPKATPGDPGDDTSADDLDDAAEGDAADWVDDEDPYVDLTPEELEALSDEEIAELVASGALVFVDEDDEIVARPGQIADGDADAARNDTYR